jgi:hypothetical protein
MRRKYGVRTGPAHHRVNAPYKLVRDPRACHRLC